jgi:hypothetical protein
MSQGIPASPANARILFKLVQTEGSANTKIEVTGFDPIGTAILSEDGTRIDYSRLTNLNPLLTQGIIAGDGSGRRPEIPRQP